MAGIKQILRCPVCGGQKAENPLNLACGNADSSALYPSVKIKICKTCGHVFNQLSVKEVGGLLKYYNEEYAPANISSPDKKGDILGSHNRNTQKRYGKLYKLLSRHIGRNFRILDVGCATGGFLDFLEKKGFKKLHGIDVSKEYVRCAKQKRGHDIRLGNAESISFGDDSMDLLIADQVVEHLIDPRKAFREARRVLTKDGLFCVSIPDASRYGEKHFFDFYWFLLREHIQHFDIEHLKLVAEQEGFVLVDCNRKETPIVSEKMILPTLDVVFKTVDMAGKPGIIKNYRGLKKTIKNYIAKELKRLNRKKQLFANLAISRKPVYVWGIGREFFYLFKSAGLKKCNIAGLIDANSFKRKTFSVGSKKIKDAAILKEAGSDSVLLISAIAHAEPINAELLKIGYRGKILKF